MTITKAATGEKVIPRKRSRPPKLRNVKVSQPYIKSCKEWVSDLHDIEIIASLLELLQKECNDRNMYSINEFITEILAGLAKKQKEAFKALSL